MRIISVLLALTIGVWFALAPASTAQAGDSPSFRYCEAGYNLERFSAQDSAKINRVVSSRLTFTGELDDGAGFKAGCKFAFFKRLYLFGDYSHASPDERAGSIFVGSTGAPSVDIQEFTETSFSRWRVGFGYSHQLTADIAAYAQVGAGHANYDSDGEIGFASSGGGGGSINPSPTRRLSVDAEIGARWLLIQRIEIGAFTRYDGAGGFRARNALLFALTGDLDDEIRGGPTAAIRVAGPVWISGRYEFGRTDRAFIGGRVAF